MRRWFAFAGLVFAVVLSLWVYWPGLSGPAVLDDSQNLSVLHQLKDHPEYARQLIFGNTSGELGRSVSMASFVAEKLWFDEGIRGVKRTNLFLHIICGFIIYLLLCQWLAVPQLRYRKELALLGATLWILSPLYVSTVLYQVQRMAQLSTLFSLLVLLSYGAWRQRYLESRPNILLFACIVVLFLLGLFAKENTALVVPLILALEFFWFGYSSDDIARSVALRRWHRAIAMGMVAFGIVLLVFAPGLVFGGYEHRDFTLLERLLTEARILWHYIAQFLWPDVNILGVYHDDYVISRRWNQPVSTVFAVCGWGLVFGLILASGKLKRWRKFVFGIVFFLVAHSLESSIIGLELYFEHRNYFPMIGVILLLVYSLGLMMQKLPETAPPLFCLASLWLVALLLKLSSQVQIWSHPDLFYMAAINGHPDSLRANVEFSNNLARKGFIDEALIYAKRANKLRSHESQSNAILREMILYCFANKAYPIDNVKKLQVDSLYLKGRQHNQTLQFLVQKINAGRCSEFPATVLADHMADQLSTMKAGPGEHNNVLLLSAQLSNAVGHYEQAADYTRRVLVSNPEYVKALLMHLHFSTALNRRDDVKAVLDTLNSLNTKKQLDKHAQYTLSLYTDAKQ